ncbi:YceD family protein [Roseovarius sp.]|uniref:YceD family protein n=1 Tax=Roseovarius sp. TaxID=1486281 RepID=UPI003B5A50EC
MSEKTENPTVLHLAQMSMNRSHPFRIEPDAPDMARMAEDLGILALKKVRLEGAMHPDDGENWKLEARLGATVVQSCVVTLDPVTTRIDEEIVRKFRKDWPGVDTDMEEIEMPEDETIDPLSDQIDLRAVLQEAIALALPPYPRSTGTPSENAQYAPPGVTPMTDADAKPFAALAKLKGQLKDGD